MGLGVHSHADGDLADIVIGQSDENLRVYATSATRVDEDAGQEMNLAQGGYGKRQLLELIQNGADAMISSPGGRIELVLTEEYLYCANEGDPIDAEGVKTLLHAHISSKRGAEIGRFGLGFKSVLGVTDTPEFFSRRVSFGFNAEWAKDQIQNVAPDRRRYPVLRLARLLDLEDVQSSDPILADLMGFATSVVRLPRNLGSSHWLQEDIKAFDRSFMLFSPHVRKLVLQDATAGVTREIELKPEGEEVAVSEGTETRRWRVFKSSIRPSGQAKREAWELQARGELPLVWAVPTEGRVSVGRFWAFFNLRDETTLTGIANAPWQVNDDRTGLLEGSQLNKELLDRLAALVLESVPELVKKDDPGWILDVIPARGSEARCWGDAYLTSRFYELAVRHAVVPDQDGHLRFAEILKLPPTDASRQALEAWAASPGRPSDWCHTTAVATRTRRSRVERLFEAVGLSEQSSLLWLQALVDVDDVSSDQVAGAILTAAAFIRPADPDAEGRRRTVQRCKILLDSTGRLREASPSDIFIPRDGESQSAMVRLIDSDLVSRAGVREALAVIGIKEVTPALELKAFISRGIHSSSAEVWNRFWALVRQVTDMDEVTSILTTAFAHRPLHVRTVSGSYHPLFQTLLPGSIVPPDGSRDAEVAIDTVYHRAELEVIRRMGADQAPTAGFPTSKDRLVSTYLNECIPTYLGGLPSDSPSPQLDRLAFDRHTHVGPLEPLRHLSGEGRALFTEELIKATSDWAPWVLKHDSQRIYPPREFNSPAIWAIEREGRLRTDLGIVPVARAWGRPLRRWAELAYVAESVPDHVADLLGIPSTAAELTQGHWEDAFACVLTSTNDRLIGDFYTFAAETGAAPPATICCRIGTTHGDRPPLAVVVTHDREAFEALRDLELPSLQVSTAEASRLLIEKWQLVPSSALVRQETHWVQEGAAATLADAFPTLRNDLEAQGLTHAEIVPCLDIFETISTDRGTQTVHKEFAKSGDRFVWRTDLGLEEALRRIAEHLPFPLSDEEIADLAEGRWKQDRRERLAEIHDEPHNEDRLLRALGEERIEARLPIGLLDAVKTIHGDDIQPVDVAKLMLAVHGDDTVHYLRDALREAGLDPPDRWAGGREARMFVRDLGFPDEFAGAPTDRRDAELIVPGPPNLPPLHDYQDRIVREIHRLIFGGEQHPRGLISLPTGAGKTRVATQALVQAISSEGLECPVLWMAPSDELCEQAVQTWSEVWRALARWTSCG